VRGARPLALAAALAAAGCGSDGPRVELETPYGAVVIQVDSVRAPRTAANFLRYVDDGRYDGAAFYRVRRDAAQLMQPRTGIVQGGLWNAPDSTRLLPPIPFESTRETGLRHTDGTVSMARFDDSLTVRAEFFIVLGTQPHLDFRDPRGGLGYAAFGRVVEGMEVLEAILEQPAKGEQLRRPVPLRARRVE
jgi:peptidyl-prolyl cis-trans isomerase A (cyclophilin A)